LLLKSPLHDIHVELGAIFTEFAGYEMPLQYTSIREEHLNVRRNVGLFDVSHMGNVILAGKDVAKLLSLTTLEDATRINRNMGQYTAILREDATIIDDIIFLHLPDDRYMVVPNAGRSEVVTKWFNDIAKRFNLDVEAKDVSRDHVILAIQGPKSRETLSKIVDKDISNMPLFACDYTKVSDIDCIISRTGYTGELGFELQITPPENTKRIFYDILDAGKEFNIKPIGLGARDTLRLEKCFLLAGNEFEGGRTPLEAGLSWLINWDHDFIGKDALLKQKEKGDYERLTCLKCIDKGIPRHGYDVEKDGKKVGKISSGNISPCLNTGIALAYIKPEFREVGSILDIVIRNKKIRSKIVKPPFVSKDWVKENP
jgi:aminomethyltransferase